MSTEILSLEEKKSLSSKYYRYFDSFVKIGLSNLPRKQIPILVFSDDNGVFVNTENNIIQAGLSNPQYNVCKDETDFICITQYLLGHEMQHVLSTPDRSWLWGISQGTRLICMEISGRIEGTGKRRFLKDSDYGNFIREMLKNNVCIDLNSIKKFIHFIQNALCDGRIERLRAQKKPGFRKLMIVSRGNDWKNSDISSFFGNGTVAPYDDLEAQERFLIKLNQILSLATTSLYQKGFLEAYGDTPLKEEVDELIPFIAKGVYASSCKACMDTAVMIETKLTDEIIELCKHDCFNSLIMKLPSQMTENASYNSNKNEEETGAPQPDASEGADQNASNASNASSGGGNGNGNTQENNPPQAQEDNYQFGSRNIGDAAGSLSEEEIEKLTEEIESAMEAAAKDARGAAEFVKAAAAPRKKQKETADTDIMPDLNTVAEKYPDSMKFTEEKRKYDLSCRMPVELESRAHTFALEVDKLFRNQTAPNVRGRTSGNVDAGKLFKLVMKQDDFYRKKEKTSEFDGCAYILMDNSGSMGNGRGSKREYACEALAIIEEGFKKHMPVKLTAFDASGDNAVFHEVIKGFNESRNESCSYNFFVKGRDGWGNKDGYSIRVATQELLTRPDREKILIVASDGCPSCYQDYKKGMADVRDAVKEARNAGIKVVGIFFADDYESSEEAKQFLSMYEYDCVCTCPENIEQELTKVLKRFVFG